MLTRLTRLHKEDPTIHDCYEHAAKASWSSLSLLAKSHGPRLVRWEGVPVNPVKQSSSFSNCFAMEKIMTSEPLLSYFLRWIALLNLIASCGITSVATIQAQAARHHLVFFSKQNYI